jgi:predicted transcriptional regulator
MAEIEEQPFLADPGDHLAAEIRKTGIRTFESAIAGEVAFVVGELEDAQAKGGEEADSGRVAFEGAST